MDIRTCDFNDRRLGRSTSCLVDNEVMAHYDAQSLRQTKAMSAALIAEIEHPKPRHKLGIAEITSAAARKGLKVKYAGLERAHCMGMTLQHDPRVYLWNDRRDKHYLLEADTREQAWALARAFVEHYI